MEKLLALTIGGGNDGPGFQILGPSQDAGGMFDLTSASIGDIVGKALGFVFAAAGIGLLLMIISSGFTLMMSAGDAKKAAAGKATLTNALIGFILVFAAFWIVQILGTILGWEGIFTIFQ